MTHPEQQRYWEDVVEGERLEEVSIPLSLHRLVVAAGGNRDFNAIHHNPAIARQGGAQDAYANNLFLQGMWEKCIRAYIGNAGVIVKLSSFRMSSFNLAGDTVTTKGKVLRKWKDREKNFVELDMWCEHDRGISVAPGSVIVALPMRPSAVS